jgi:hypothetical protein
MSGVSFSIYDLNTGAIKRIGSAPNPAEQVLEGEGFVYGKYSGDLYTIDVLTATPVEKTAAEREPVELARSKGDVLNRVETKIKRVRQQYITDLPGQDAIYEAKRQEAIAYLAESPEPATLIEYPMIAAEVGTTAPTAHELAQLWLNMNVQWKTIAATLESIRVPANASIDAATTTTEIEAILAQFEADITTAGF